MKNKILGLSVCMLLIATSVFPVIGIANTLNHLNPKIDSTVDISPSIQSEFRDRDTIDVWINRTPSVVGSNHYPRERFAMVYDSTNDRTIVFGGYDTSGNKLFNDTWVYNYSDNTWYNKTANGAIPPRRDFGMAYDSTNDRTIMFGGDGDTGAGGMLNDTWLYSFSDNTWYNMTPNATGGTLTKRTNPSMAYDSDAQRVIMFGGYDGVFLNETWAYNFSDNTWYNLSTTDSGGSLPGLADGRLAYDSVNQVTVMFGGKYGGGSGESLNETWVFHYGNKTWVKKNPDFVGGTLAPRYMHTVAYDANAERVVLFGGDSDAGSNEFNDTWLYNVSDNTWYTVSYNVVGGTLWPREAPEIVYDSSACKIILFGGWEDDAPGPSETLNETWVFLYNYEDQPPNTPTQPSGPTWLNLNEQGTYDTSAVDPDGDQVQYRFDWDANGSHDYSGWTDFVPSGTVVTLSHSWSTGGTYVVKAQARDFYGCKSEWSAGLTVVVNSAPNSPSDPDPPDGATNIDINADLSWNCSDPDGDDLTYDVYFEANDPSPDELVSNNQSETTYDPGEMEYSTHYYWQIVAWDEHGASIEGPVWDFTTTSDPNEPPYEPSDPDPENGSTDIDIEADLSWTGGGTLMRTIPSSTTSILKRMIQRLILRWLMTFPRPRLTLEL